MAVERKQIKMYIERVMIFCIRTIYRSACGHPFIFALAFFLFILYRNFPSLFAFLVSTSPIIVCTTLLLGLLLIYGEPNIPEIEEQEEEDNKNISEISSLKVNAADDDQLIKKDESFMVEKHVEEGIHIEEIAEREVFLGEGSYNLAEEVHTERTDYQGKEKVSTGENSSVEEKKYAEEGEIFKERETRGQEISKNREASFEREDRIVTDDNNVGTRFHITEKKELDGLMPEIQEPALNHQLDSSFGSPWQHIRKHVASSGSDSDRVESSSDDASMTYIIPLLDELHPLLDIENPQNAVPKDISDSVSQGSSADHELDDNSGNEQDDNSIKEEGENHEVEDKEAGEEKDDRAEAAVKWNDDDQKNVMDLGSSELERNRRLESLIAKRRARKNLAFTMERNLIDLDDSMMRFQFPTISAPRRNPFDLPSDFEESDLPPIPGSAPSTLLPRRNPFDFLFEQEDEISNMSNETSSRQEYMPVPQRDMLFKRNETFSLGRRELNQERRHSRLKPYFVAEMTDSEEGTSTFRRQFSDKSDYSKASSVPESDSVSSVADHDHKELMGWELPQESELSPLLTNDLGNLDRERRSSEEDEPSDAEDDQNIHGTVGENDFSTNLITHDTHSATESLPTIVEEIKEESERNSTISDAEELEVIEEIYDEQHSCTSDSDEKIIEKNINNQLADFEQETHDIEASDAYQWLLKTEDEETSFFEVSSSKQFEISTHSGNAEILSVHQSITVSANDELLIVPPIILSTEENKSLSPEIKQDSHRDVEMSAVRDDSEHSFPLVILDPTALDGLDHLSLSSTMVGSSGHDLIDASVMIGLEEDDMVDAAVYSRSVNLIPSELERAVLSMENSAIKTFPCVMEESHGNIFPKDNSDISEPSKEKVSFVDFDQAIDLTNLEKYEEIKIESTIKREQSLSNESREEATILDESIEFPCVPEDSNSSVSHPYVTDHDSGIKELQSSKQRETFSFSVFTQNFELNVPPNAGSSELSDDVKDADQSMHKDVRPEILDSSVEELNEIHPDIFELKDFDESLLSELDTVGDFNVQGLKSTQQGSESYLYTYVETKEISTGSSSSDVHPRSFLPLSEGETIAHDEIFTSPHSASNVHGLQEMRSVDNHFTVRESEVESSFLSYSGDLEQTVYNPKYHVLEERFVPDLDVAPRVPHEGTILSSIPEENIDCKKIVEPVLESTQADISQKDTEQMKKNEEALDRITPSETGSLNVLNDEFIRESIETDPELLVIGAKTLEDIHVALQQHSVDELSEKATEVTESINEASESMVEIDEKMRVEGFIDKFNVSTSNEVDSPQKYQDEVGLDSHTLSEDGYLKTLNDEVITESIEMESELHVIEAKTLEDLHVSLQKHSVDRKSEEAPRITESLEESMRDMVEEQNAEEKHKLREGMTRENGSGVEER